MEKNPGAEIFFSLHSVAKMRKKEERKKLSPKGNFKEYFLLAIKK